MAGKVCEIVEKNISKIITDLGYEIVEIDYSKKVDGMNLEIVIDSPNGVDMNDCEKVHKAIDGPLDELNPTDDKPYILSVSSPGIDRPIKTIRDFERNKGIEVELKLFAPIDKKKIFVGNIIGFDDKSVELQIDGNIIKFNRADVANIAPNIKI